jgi:hypothetical protein
MGETRHGQGALGEAPGPLDASCNIAQHQGELIGETITAEAQCGEAQCGEAHVQHVQQPVHCTCTARRGQASGSPGPRERRLHQQPLPCRTRWQTLARPRRRGSCRLGLTSGDGRPGHNLEAKVSTQVTNATPSLPYAPRGDTHTTARSSGQGSGVGWGSGGARTQQSP